uniref:Uncharacterized protein n=1 Tax=Vitrella brassicaformis TaxID=1169539 RepID=A0A7S1KCI0_9ALVE|mmetsp:Transcript_4819/g.11185  ORF Transcript_4819/g.11185 Transcript_4819/m.11185 type:complete len:278 (+) Transcript_4819:158-991(+)
MYATVVRAFDTWLGSFLGCIGLVVALPWLLLQQVRKIQASGLLPLNLWDIFHGLQPFPIVGPAAVSNITSLVAPYTGSIFPTLRLMEVKGNTLCIVASVRNRPYLRNPFDCLHAAALANLGEFVGGTGVVIATQLINDQDALEASKGGEHATAATAPLPPPPPPGKVRAILKALQCTYHKKATSTVTGTCEVDLAAIKACCADNQHDSSHGGYAHDMNQNSHHGAGAGGGTGVYVVKATLTDESAVRVAEVETHWAVQRSQKGRKGDSNSNRSHKTD